MEPLQTLSSPLRPRSPFVPRSVTGIVNSGRRSPRSGRENAPPIHHNGRENTPPIHHNVQIDLPSSPTVPKKASEIVARPPVEIPRLETQIDGSTDPSDSSVKVVVRIRPQNENEGEEERFVQKLSSDSVSVGDRKFTFDSVLGSESTQEDVFKLVGVPLVKNSLAGFNTSVLSYGQTGSGKTYTMWGPPSAMVDAHSINSYQGIVPRIFQMLFAEIDTKQESAGEKQVHYQCRCSFLEIYNNQINDLLGSIQRNLQIKDDPRNGFHVENLTEEYVTGFDDVTQILIKGLSNRKVGATSTNCKSSRSHIMFTCIIESWCKGSSSKCFSSSKSSRISLIDLAGSNTDKLDGASRHSREEVRHVKKSLANLGKVINILAEKKDQQIPYMGSCLTHLLQETLGGNAKVTLICAISPNERFKSGTLSTLRFGERAKVVQDKAVVNEITEDDVNGLSDQIRQLKEELISVKSYRGNAGGHYNGSSARDSLNLLRVSLNRALILPRIDDDDSEEEVDINEDDARELCVQLSKIDPSFEEDLLKNKSVSLSEEIPKSDCGDSHLDGTCSGQVNVNSFSEENEIKEVSATDAPNHSGSHTSAFDAECKHGHHDCFGESSISTIPLCESPKISNNLRKSILASDNFSSENLSFDNVHSSLQSSKVCPTESLAASLRRGLQIIDFHQRNSSSPRKSLLGLSFEHLASISPQPVNKVDAGAQTLEEDGCFTAAPFLCSSCKRVSGDSETQIMPVFKDDDRILVDITKREMKLVTLCAEQASAIEQLNRLVDQYKQNPSAEVLCLEYSADAASEPKNEGVEEWKSEREALHEKIQSLRDQLKSNTDVSLLEQIRKGDSSKSEEEEELDRERKRWTESESRWISLTEELRLDLESNRRIAEKKEMELDMEKKCTAELDDALRRSILGHARFIEHYTELQEKHESLLWSHRKVMQGIAEVKRAAEKAGGKRAGSAFVGALAAELSTLRVERERERAYLKEQNKGLRVQLRDTAEAVHAAGELLVRLREAEEAVSVTEEKYRRAQQEAEKLRKQMEKMKKKHAMEMVTMKHYLAESRLPESALEPFYLHEDAGSTENPTARRLPDEEHSWRAAFRPSYQ